VNEAVEKCAALRDAKLSVQEIARVMRVHPRTVNKWLALAPPRSGPVIDPIPRTVEAIRAATVELCATAIDQLRAMNPNPATTSAVLARLSRVLIALPSPDPGTSDAGLALEEFRAELTEKLRSLNEISPPPSIEH
jgi:hypothetical protein